MASMIFMGGARGAGACSVGGFELLIAEMGMEMGWGCLMGMVVVGGLSAGCDVVGWASVNPKPSASCDVVYTTAVQAGIHCYREFCIPGNSRWFDN